MITHVLLVYMMVYCCVCTDSAGCARKRKRNRRLVQTKTLPISLSVFFAQAGMFLANNYTYLYTIYGIWYMTLSNIQFRTSLRFRYQYPVEGRIEGGKCNCTHHNNGITNPDAAGHHFVTGCINDGFRIRSHDAIAREFNSCLQYCGFYTVMEEKHAFNYYHTGLNNNRRPDIAIKNPIKTNKLQQYLDIQITSPYKGT